MGVQSSGASHAGPIIIGVIGAVGGEISRTIMGAIFGTGFSGVTHPEIVKRMMSAEFFTGYI